MGSELHDAWNAACAAVLLGTVAFLFCALAAVLLRRRGSPKA